MNVWTENPSVETTFDVLAGELVDVDVAEFEYVLFGSAVLYLHELRSHMGDVDVFVSQRVYDELRSRPRWRELAPREGDPPFLELLGANPPVHAFYGWTARDSWMNVATCFSRAKLVGAWPCTPLDEILRHKREACANWNGVPGGQEKHVRDIALLEAHLGMAAA